jgi:hypothetical protein
MLNYVTRTFAQRVMLFTRSVMRDKLCMTTGNKDRAGKGCTLVMTSEGEEFMNNLKDTDARRVFLLKVLSGELTKNEYSTMSARVDGHVNYAQFVCCRMDAVLQCRHRHPMDWALENMTVCCVPLSARPNGGVSDDEFNGSYKACASLARYCVTRVGPLQQHSRDVHSIW